MTTIQTTIQTLPLNALVPSPANVRRTNPGQGVEELAASIAAHGLLQNLTVRCQPRKGKKAPCHEVIAGGRRLAALKLLAQRGQLAKDAPIPCHVVTEGISEEVSLAENALQCPMHPADQYEAFARLHGESGMAAEDIAARFGVTAAVVRQRLKLGAISPKLMQLYRDEELSLDQLTAFAITDDHAAQERAWDALPSSNTGRAAILALLSEGQVASDDRRARFVGIDAYQAAGGTIVRDLFDAEEGGFLADPALLDRLVREKLEAEAETVRAEGWAWVMIEPQFDYALTASMRRLYPQPLPLDPAQQARLDALEARHEALSATDEEAWTDESAAAIDALEAEMAAIGAEEQFLAEDIARSGAVVTIHHDGELRIERGYLRKEDAAKPLAEDREAQEKPSTGSGLSGSLVAELTACRTAGLRDALAQNPSLALVAVTHALAAQAFYHASDAVSCLDLSGRQTLLSSHAKGIEDSPAGLALAERHEAWARRMPEEAGELWGFVAGLEEAERLALLAHAAALTVNAVRRDPSGSDSRMQHADRLAEALALDMTRCWTPTAEGYFRRVSKPHILDAVREGVSVPAADNIAALKKAEMAEAAERLLAGQGWLPPLLRTKTA